MKNLIILLCLLCSVSLMGQKRVMVDPGHGYKNGRNIDGRTTTEINTNWYVGDLLKSSLISCSGVTARQTCTKYNALYYYQRPAVSNSYGADRFISIHCNAGKGDGTETFRYYNSTGGLRWATKINNAMVKHGQWRNRGVKQYGFNVLRYTNCYAALSEIGFVDTRSNSIKLLSNTWRSRFRNAYVEATNQELGLRCALGGGTQPPPPTSSKPGSFNAYVTRGCAGTNNYNKLTWTASAGATSYKIYRNGSYYTTVTGRSFVNYTIGSGGTRNIYRVVAVNSKGTTYNANGSRWGTALSCPRFPTEGTITDNTIGENTLRLMPNPAVNDLNIQFFAVDDASIKIEVYNIQGQQVIHEDRVASAGEVIDMNLDVSELPSGTYMIRCISKDRVLSEKFVKE